MTSSAFDYETRSETNACPLDAVFEHPTKGAQYFVDFDHTLMLASSTERFLDSVRPSILFAVLLKALGVLAPWRITGKNGYFVWRDWLRVGMVCLLAPWSHWVFSRSARAVFDAHLNPDLDRYLSTIDPKDIVIVSFGFEFVIRELIRGTRYESAKIVAPTFWKMVRNRKRGKVSMLAGSKCVIDPIADVVITDSAVDDADLLSAVRKGYVITWGSNNTTGALSNTYIPFFYTAQIKRTPGFFVKQVLLEEMAVMVLAFSIFAGTSGIMLAAALIFLFLANFLIYEIGYAENDRVGLKTEDSPKLSSNFFRYKNYSLEPAAWVWAGLATILGMVFLGPEHGATALERLNLPVLGGYWQNIAALSAIWFGFIIVGRLCFWTFNHVPLRIRVFFYIPLHITKYFGPIILVPLHAIGCALLVAQIIRTWALYAIRRSGGDTEFVISQAVRLMFFIGLLGMLTLSFGVAAIFGIWQTWVLIAFCVLRALPEIYKKLIRDDN